MGILHDIGKYFLMIKLSFSKTCKREVLYKQVFKEINDLILDSIQIVSILSFFIGGVVSIQMALNLENPLLSKTLIGYATRQSVILEFAPTFISIIMAGKVGSYITSSIGTMRVTEQIDALEVMGVNSASYLILPKIVAQLFFNPLLILMSIFLGLWGGAMAGDLLGLIAFQESISGYQLEFIVFENIIYGLIKSVVYAFIIGSVSAYCGYTVKGGAVEVGVASTNAVVRSCLAIILSNYVLTDLLLN